MRIGDSNLIDKSKLINFYFNGKKYSAFEGDTIASALLSNGIFLSSRSIKYHRPRGVFSHGYEEPNSIFEVGSGDEYEPNILATRKQVYEGMKIKSTNSWPSLNTDLFYVFNIFSNFLKAGFYYKTFFGSNILWKNIFEPFLRKMAGFTKAPNALDKSIYNKKNIVCDVLIIGGGPSGLSAAYSLSNSNLNIILIEDDILLGGKLINKDQKDWFYKIKNYINKRIKIYRNTTVFGAYENNYYTAVQRFPEESLKIKEKLLLIRAEKVILATGSIERPIVFPNNDRPGIFLSSSSTYFLNQFGVLLGRKIILFTNNDFAYSDILNLHNYGAKIIAIIDVRKDIIGEIPLEVESKNIKIYNGYTVSNTFGTKKINRLSINEIGGEKTFDISCDCLLVSGGYSPSIHLHAQQGGEIVYDKSISSFIPNKKIKNQFCIGSLVGKIDFLDCVEDGVEVGKKILAELEIKNSFSLEIPDIKRTSYGDIEPIWMVKSNSKLESKSFVDFQNDTTVSDIKIAKLEGFNNPEHIKRYTLNGFGTDQGKTGSVNSLGIISELSKVPIENFKPTTYRSPFVPVYFGVLAGRSIGQLSDPVRNTALQDLHKELHAEFEDVGQWKRPWFYRLDCEEMSQAVSRECLNVRSGVGMLDASTLGKIEISGKDSLIFLNRVYTNNWSEIKVGKIKYGLLLKEDGMILDDGTTTRLSEGKYLMTTTTGNAAIVLDWLEEWLQTEWRDLNVFLTSVTDHWGVITLSGPKSREVISRLNNDFEFKNENFPFMTFREINLLGIDCRVFRISFTGELSYEINVPWPFAPFIWKKLLEYGGDYNITPYGTETMHVLRAEKGFPIIGQDTDGTINPIELGMSALISNKKDFIGKRSLSREFKSTKYFVGFKTIDPQIVIPEGAQIFQSKYRIDIKKVNLNDLLDTNDIESEGYVTSSYFSPILNKSIALGYLQNGRQKINSNDIFYATGENNELIGVNIVNSIFYDPKGLRRDG
ncbi:2Fe-2S iron-sulfur cluster-binding protein [Alphaproteobacteria bacterium]|nr:2Fe-2S iron-sulfur cluster-binding protein [Alphaproteobacteria bacterium]